MLSFAAEKGFIQKAAKQGDVRISLKSASLKDRGLGYLWNKEAGYFLGVGKGVWR